MPVPLATYRLQLNPSFGFTKAREIVHYLSHLGISDLYASPIFKATKGSLHGYDITEPNLLNPELGSKEDFHELTGEVKKRGMGWVQDIVPNHMAFDGDNVMLMDVVENGENSKYFSFFDITWDHPYESLRGRLLAPFLGSPFGECLDAGEITLRYGSGGFFIQYFELSLPLRIESYGRVITHRLSTLKTKLGDDHPDFIKMLGILYTLKSLPSYSEDVERDSQIQFVKRILWELYTTNQDIQQFIEDNLTIFNGTSHDPESLTLLDNLLSEQLFRLSFWKVATEEINYRRFFNINGLISLRMEDGRVFFDTHELLLDLVKNEVISGVRVDHIDGLSDPSGYLRTLRKHVGNIYVTVEKILEHRETLPSDWPVEGTTGYDSLNYINGVFCEDKNGRKFNKIYYDFTGFKTTYEVLLYEKKKLIIEKEMTGDVDNLAHYLKKISSRDRYGSDITLYGLKKAIVEVLALFPIYRTYISNDLCREEDRHCIRETVQRAREINPGLIHELDFIERFLLRPCENPILSEEDSPSDLSGFVMRLQQLTGPLMAKGFEDTTLYVYNRLISLNEVGGSPEHFGITLKEFHDFHKRRLHTHPYTMNTTSTHDTKRGEDVRARINVLSEIPEEWNTHIKKWSKLNQGKKKMSRGMLMPDRNDEYFLYQTLVGSFPFSDDEHERFLQRLKDYIVKAVREAKIHTAWLKPDSEYEDAYRSFIDEIMVQTDNNEFLDSFLPFQRKVAWCGLFNSLSQTLLKITVPGLPDFYQGTELWDLNFVDPDNRRPVDFGRRISFLTEIKEKEHDRVKLIKELFSTHEDGRIKLFLIYSALKARQEHRELFGKGIYIPLSAAGGHEKSVVAFAREHRDFWAITIAPRLLTDVIKEETPPLGHGVWGETHIPLTKGLPSLWRDAITGQHIEGGKILRIDNTLNHFPCALLVGEAQR